MDLPDPHPGAAQVRIAVRAAGVNPRDWKKRKGLGRPKPGTVAAPPPSGRPFDKSRPGPRREEAGELSVIKIFR